MSQELAQHIEQIKIVDTHEHLRGEEEWVEEGPGDVLCDLFSHYALHDIVAAGAEAADAVE